MRSFKRPQKTDFDPISEIQDISEKMPRNQRDRLEDFAKQVKRALQSENGTESARQLLSRQYNELNQKAMQVKNARLWDEALTRLEDRITQKAAKKRFGLTGKFTKIAAMGAGSFALAASFGAPVAAVTISISAISLVRNSWKQVSKQRIELAQNEDSDFDSADIPGLGGEIKKRIKDKFLTLRHSAQEVAQTAQKAKDYRTTQDLSLTQAFAKAAWDNKGHIAVIAGAVAGLAFKASGLGEWAFDDAMPSQTSESPVIVSKDLSPDLLSESPSELSTDSDEPSEQKSNKETLEGTEETSDRGSQPPPNAEDQIPELAEEKNISLEQETTSPNLQPLTNPEPEIQPAEEGLTSEQIEKIESAGLPVPADADPQLQLRLAEVLPQLDSLSPDNQQYISELYERMASQDAHIQAQAYKDYAHLALNCMDGIEGLDNQSLAWDLINQAYEMGEHTNAQAMDFKAYMLMHGIGVESNMEQAADLLMHSYDSHGSPEALRLLHHIQENNLVSAEMLTDFPEIAEQDVEPVSAETNESIETDVNSQNEANGIPEKAAHSASTKIDELPADKTEVTADEIISLGTDFNIEQKEGLLNCTSKEETTVTRAAIEISTGNFEAFECAPAPE